MTIATTVLVISVVIGLGAILTTLITLRRESHQTRTSDGSRTTKVTVTDSKGHTVTFSGMELEPGKVEEAIRKVAADELKNTDE